MQSGPHDGRVVIIVDLKIAGIDIDGDELAVIVRAKHAPHPSFEDLLAALKTRITPSPPAP